MSKTLENVRNELSVSAQKGYPILISGAVFFLVLALLSLYIPRDVLYLVWVVGLGVIFPLGIIIGKLLNINIITKDNPLGTLGGIVAGMQAFFIPVFIMVYQNNPEWLPFTVGLLGASHFLPYYWIYDSKAYLFLAIATGLVAFVAGGTFIGSAFLVTPLGIATVYAITVVLVLRENRDLKK